MKGVYFLNSIIMLCFTMLSFSLQANTEDITRKFALDVYGYSMETTINEALDPIKESHFFNRLDENKKMDYILHLKAHLIYIYEPIVVDAVKRNFTVSEMKHLLVNPYLLEEKPFLSKMNAASKLANKNIQAKSDDISRMVTLVTVHHLCLEKGKGECPKSFYSEYPNKTAQKPMNSQKTTNNSETIEKCVREVNEKINNTLHKLSPQSMGQHSACKVHTQLSPKGEVLDVSIVESSGNSEIDKLIMLAIRKSSPLPLPKEPLLAEEFRDLTLTFK